MNRIYLIALFLLVFACKDEKKNNSEELKQVEVIKDSLIFSEESHFNP